MMNSKPILFYVCRHSLSLLQSWIISKQTPKSVTVFTMSVMFGMKKQDSVYQGFDIMKPSWATTAKWQDLCRINPGSCGGWWERSSRGSGLRVNRESCLSASHCGPQWSGAGSVGPMAMASHWAGHLSLFISNPVWTGFRHLCAYPRWLVLILSKPSPSPLELSGNSGSLLLAVFYFLCA